MAVKDSHAVGTIIHYTIENSTVSTISIINTNLPKKGGIKLGQTSPLSTCIIITI